ncbi:unnamed protein product, partial [Didymodactylos carnosus]
MVYYPFDDQVAQRTQNDFVTAAQLAASSTVPGHVAIVQGIKGLSPLLNLYKNVQESALFDYMHAVCGGSGHTGHLIRKWLVHVKLDTAMSMSDF